MVRYTRFFVLQLWEDNVIQILSYCQFCFSPKTIQPLHTVKNPEGTRWFKPIRFYLSTSLPRWLLLSIWLKRSPHSETTAYLFFSWVGWRCVETYFKLLSLLTRYVCVVWLSDFKKKKMHTEHSQIIFAGLCRGGGQLPWVLCSFQSEFGMKVSSLFGAFVALLYFVVFSKWVAMIEGKSQGPMAWNRLSHPELFLLVPCPVGLSWLFSS